MRTDKRVKLLIIILVLILSASSFIGCGGGNGADEKSTSSYSSDAESGVEGEEAESFAYWMNYGFEKVISTDSVPAAKKRNTEVTLYMGRGESESATLSVYTAQRLQDVSITVKEKPSDVSVVLYKQHYQTIHKRKFPDGISLLNDSFDLRSDTVQSYLATVTTTSDTEAGDKSIILEMKNKDKEVIATFTVKLHIWNIVYPEPTYRTATDITENIVAKLEGLEVGTEEFRTLYAAYYEKLLSYRMCAYDLPYDILDSRADAYMSDPRVTAFQIPTAVDDETLRAYYEKVSANPIWLKKAYAYPFDEPTSVEMYDKVIALLERIEAICPELKVVVPFFKNFDYDGVRDAVDVQAQYMEIFCVNIETFDQVEFPKRVTEELEKNPDLELWTYVCWGPRHPYTNLFVNEKGIDHRIQFWQQYTYEADGFLYWSSTYWAAVGNPWLSMMTVPDLSREVFGDGSLMYTGVGNEDACGSLRLDIVRDGIEDMELLKMAESQFGRDWVMNKVKTVSKSLTNYTTNTNTFLKVRNEIAEALEEALNDK